MVPITSTPPGRSTRSSSRTARAGSGRNSKAAIVSTRSKLPSPKGSSAISSRRKRISAPARTAFCRAWSIIFSATSTAVTRQPISASLRLKLPVPQPASSTLWPAAGSSRPSAQSVSTRSTKAPIGVWYQLS